MAVNNQSKYPLRYTMRRRKRGPSRVALFAAAALVLIAGSTFLLPQAVILQARLAQEHAMSVTIAESGPPSPFPVSVNPGTKSIVNNPEADLLFKTTTDSLPASVGEVSEVISLIAREISSSALYQTLAAASGHLITVNAGDRKEQVLAQLVSALHWNTKQVNQFVTAVDAQTPGITDGTLAPGNYVVDDTMTPANVAALMSVRFNQAVLSHYSTTTAALVPLDQALTVASLIERESGGPDDMRQISGIIWNRLFDGMNLQIDATLQYAKGENSKGNWWTAVLPKDKYVNSPYNTYANSGLPPGPIAEPSTAAVIAALNPVQTSCLYYFHDANGNFHCSDTYAEHVALLKKYYGQGK